MHLQVLSFFMNSFFHIVRASSYCVSARPPADRIKQEGDFTQSWWMKSFFDGTIDLSLQSDNDGCILLNRADADRVRRFTNPLRDSLVVVKRDGVFSLKDGFHMLCEALARGYRGRVCNRSGHGRRYRRHRRVVSEHSQQFYCQCVRPFASDFGRCSAVCAICLKKLTRSDTLHAFAPRRIGARRALLPGDGHSPARPEMEARKKAREGSGTSRAVFKALEDEIVVCRMTTCVHRPVRVETAARRSRRHKNEIVSSFDVVRLFLDTGVVSVLARDHVVDLHQPVQAEATAHAS